MAAQLRPSVFVFAVAALSFSHLASASQWPVVQQTTQEAVPNIEISLAPPVHPWPQVAAELGNLEESRENIENSNMAKLQKEFNEATLDARRRVGDVIGSAMRAFDDPKLTNVLLAARTAPKSVSMLRQLPQDIVGASALSVKVNAFAPNPPDPMLRADIDDIESLRSNKESDMFESALEDLKALSSFVMKELEVQVHDQVNGIVGGTAQTAMLRSSAFLEDRSRQLPAQSNIRAVPTDMKYPTVASMVQDMESRRDISENLARKRILEKEIDFLMDCNDAINNGLKTAVARILAQHSTMAKSLQHAA